MELTDVCDGSSRIIIRLEMQEGADRMFHMKLIHEANYYKSTACTIRMFEPWFWTWRVCVGDSWFGSSRSAVALFLVRVPACVRMLPTVRRAPSLSLIPPPTKKKTKKNETLTHREACCRSSM